MIFITAVCHIHKGRPRHVLLQTLVLLSRYPRESISQMPRAIRNALPSVKAPWSVNFVLWASAPVFLDSGPERGTKQSAHNHRNHAVSWHDYWRSVGTQWFWWQYIYIYTHLVLLATSCHWLVQVPLSIMCMYVMCVCVDTTFARRHCPVSVKLGVFLGTMV